ncbi:leucyl aminopeptidase [Nocardioides luteus]|uniref:Probable cytosol aminopeptidase n=1 Tax=Nocardioides luteus TaxID=1844 RepID=A0ABQ5T3M0_9ACTN|nr:leucyl aminopeptidase family protein [Nocardioides luteus]MDR7309533.1 leucyl aminopeptidase [Nocardioides luteus]GGR51896.1 leucyl aminopeptidase [Nocardioides luteus]GLJ70684.1 leucyl aminopeptidase [Nocardioides luteus]
MSTTLPSQTLPKQVEPPTFTLSPLGPESVDAEIIALPVLPGDDALLIGPGAADLEDHHDLLGHLEFEGATGSAGEVTTYAVTGSGALRQILLIGVGEQRRDDFRRAGAALARAVRDRTHVVTTIPAVDPEVGLEPFVAGATLASFLFHWRSEGAPWTPVETITLADLGDDQAAALERAEAIARAGWRARFYATVPSNLKNPAWLAEQATALAGETGLKIDVWDEERLAAEGFGGIVAVGQGSATPPRLIRLDYTPRKAGRKTPTIVLVGKGITFDTGGLNIKPGDGMLNMKRDMTGGAVVLAVMSALAEVGCPVKVVGLIASAENAISGSALRPGDVVAHYGGRTSEVTNTDAEGRLVLADAMAYAAEKVKPAAMVDIATLTGAMRVALGQTLAGCFADDDELAARLIEASDASGEALWRMPLVADYEEKLSSKVADADNAPGGPGAITAALFLHHFTGGVPWAHVDVAGGDAYADVHELTPGPTGFGARVLLTWLAGADPLDGVGA